MIAADTFKPETEKYHHLSDRILSFTVNKVVNFVAPLNAEVRKSVLSAIGKMARFNPSYFGGIE